MSPAASFPDQAAFLIPLAERVSLAPEAKTGTAISSTAEVVAQGPSVCGDPAAMPLRDRRGARVQWHTGRTGQVYRGPVLMG